jgi:hypothetical protein
MIRNGKRYYREYYQLMVEGVVMAELWNTRPSSEFKMISDMREKYASVIEGQRFEIHKVIRARFPEEEPRAEVADDLEALLYHS